MPIKGKSQKPAGVNTTPPAKRLGTRKMVSRRHGVLKK